MIGKDVRRILNDGNKKFCLKKFVNLAGMGEFNPALNAKSISALASLITSLGISTDSSYDHNTFRACQTWSRLGKTKPSAKIKFRTHSEPTISNSRDDRSYCATKTSASFSYAPLKYT